MNTLSRTLSCHSVSIRRTNGIDVMIFSVSHSPFADLVARFFAVRFVSRNKKKRRINELTELLVTTAAKLHGRKKSIY